MDGLVELFEVWGWEESGGALVWNCDTLKGSVCQGS